LPGADIKSFEVPQTFLDELRATAVTNEEKLLNPNAPLKVDLKYPDQYGVRPQQIEQLINAIIPGSGRVG